MISTIFAVQQFLNSTFNAGLVMLHALIGPQNEAAACEVGPMEAAQCRAAGWRRGDDGRWEVQP